MKKVNFVFSTDPDEETYSAELYDTKEEAIEAGRTAAIEEIEETYLDPEEKIAALQGFFYVARAEQYEPTIDAGDLIEVLTDEASDEYGEPADDWLEYVDKADVEKLGERLTAIFREWLTETHNEPNFYGILNAEPIDILEEGRA